MKQPLADLNAEQRRAAEAGEGPIVIIAGPGTGKTKTLTARIAFLVETKRARPGHILALTFTKKAAEEMQARVAVPGVRITTFHALCHELLGGELEFISEPARLQIIKKLPRPAKFKGLAVRELALLVSRAKNMAEDDAELSKMVHAYDAALIELGQLDFDDLLVRARDLLQTNPEMRHAQQQRYSHILVDEFQDTNLLQYEFLKLLCGNDNLFVIGDPLQSIYGFRGANGNIFEQFTADFPQARTITLHVNYRSAPQIVQLSNALFKGAAQLEPFRTAGGRVRTVQVLNEYSEAVWVLAEIQKAIGGGDFLNAVSDDDHGAHRTLKDFAILYRSRAVAKAIQTAVAESGLPYQIVGDGSPYDQPQVQAVIALMRACLDGQRPAHEGFRDAEWRALLDLLTQRDQVSPQALADRIANTLGFEPSLALQQFTGGLVRFKDLPAAVSYFDAIAQQNFYDPEADAITLLTIHASKGLEFSHVFMIAAEEGVLPHERADMAEEKRLFYVAATRAKHNLDIVHTKARARQPADLSRFAANVPDAILPKTVDPNLAIDQRRAQKRAIKRSQQTLF